jgi:hypothetical protein
VERISGDLLREIVHVVLEGRHVVAEKPVEAVRDGGAGELPCCRLSGLL